MSGGGLSSQEAATRLARDGPNALPTGRRPTVRRRFAEQLVHFFALMLWAAAALALLADLPELAVAIALVVVLNATFATVQQARSDHAADRLRELLPRQVTVRRDGRPLRVDAGDVVVGDVLLLDGGDRVPADAELVDAAHLLVDRSLLTGESEPERLQVPDLVLAGTFVAEGEAVAVVQATGERTRLAQLARMTVSGVTPISPLDREIRAVVRTISLIALAVGASFLGLALALGEPVSASLVLAIGVTVALVPEALLPTVTLALAWGGEQLAHRGVLVRNLEAVETLGSTTFICTDKTGTLTLNQMTVVHGWTPSGVASGTAAGYDPSAPVQISPVSAAPALRDLAGAAARCSTGYAERSPGGWVARGDPMEAAVDVFARRLGVVTTAGAPDPDVVARFPFDPRRRRMSVATADRVFVKGAPDSVLPLCRPEPGAAAALEHLAERGLRVLAVASRPTGDAGVPGDVQEAERDLVLLGLLGLEDPPRDDVGTALEACRRAGIKLAMVTGDHPSTATTIATEVGLRRPDDPVLRGQDLPVDDEELVRILEHDGVVVARVAPEEKLRIARALQAAGHVVAMTGDGVNDGPALRAADIGVAMGSSGTDVAREAADLVLLDDHFATIVSGIEQGRATFLNVRRFLTYHLTDNVAELAPFALWGLTGGRFPLALGVLQVLAIDIGTDTFPAVALGAEPPASHALDRPPVSGRLLDRSVLRRSFGRLGPTVAAMTICAFTVSLVASGWGVWDASIPDDVLASASGAAFMAIVFGQAANAVACRSTTRSAFELGWRSNRLLPWAVLSGLAVSVSLLLIPPLAAQLGHAAPPLAGWVVVALTVPAVLIVDSASKAGARRRREDRPG